MGVDFSANYGVGVELVNIDFEELDMDGIEYMDEYLEELPEPDSIQIGYFEVGQGNYTGETNTFFLCVKASLADGETEFLRKISAFKDYLKDNKIEYKGEVDFVGGLLIH